MHAQDNMLISRLRWESAGQPFVARGQNLLGCLKELNCINAFVCSVTRVIQIVTHHFFKISDVFAGLNIDLLAICRKPPPEVPPEVPPDFYYVS